MKKSVLKVSTAVFVLLFIVGISQLAAQIDVNRLVQGAQQQSSGIKTLANWILGIILLIGVIVVGYKLTSGKPEAKEGLVGWIAGVIFIGVAMALINL